MTNRKQLLAGSVAALLALAPMALGSSIGPDAFGYVANDATQYSFVDISSTGTAVLAGADDDKAAVAIPFAFNFYGQTHTSVCIGSNGLLTFGGCNADFANQDLTASAPAGNLPTIAPLWTDLSFAASGAGSVHYQALGTPGSRQFIVQWTNAYPLNAPEGVTFQVILYENTGRILFQYRDASAGAGARATNGAAATVGIRDANGQTNGRRLQWSHNSPVLRDSYAIEFMQLGVTPVELGKAGPSYWAVLTIGKAASLAMSGSTVVGGPVAEVGVAAETKVDMSGSARINGKLWLAAGSELKTSGDATVAGGVVQGAAADPFIAQAVLDALAASQAAASLPATMPAVKSVSIEKASGSQTISAGPGRHVLNLEDVVISGGTLTLQGPADARFVINVSGRFELTGGGSIMLAGGLMPFNVLFNVIGHGHDIVISAGSAGGVPRTQASGVVLAPAREVTLEPGLLLGEVIAGGAKVTIEGAAEVRNPF